MSDKNDFDPRGLIREAYAIEEISAGECRSIFLDWAMFDDHAVPQRDRIAALLKRYEAEFPDHPMTAILREGLAEAPQTGRRRGGRSRRSGSGKA